MSSQSSTSRIDAVDALRGFALVGVGLVHVIEQFAGAPPTEAIAQAASAGLADRIIGGITMMLLMGKFYLIFSLLFGLSFFIQIDKPHRRGESFAGRFAWRLAILLGIGYLHHFFYRADILMVYAVLGFLLLIAYRLPTRVLLVAAAILFLGAGRYISFAFFNESWPSHTADSAVNLAYFEILKHGTLGEVMATNSVDGLTHLAAFEFGVFGRAYVTLGLFLVGLCLGRSGFFVNPAQHGRQMKKTLIWGTVAALVSFVAMAAAFSRFEQQPPDFTTWPQAFALTLYDLFNLSFGTVLACIFVLAATRLRLGSALINLFAPYGRMALTNYLLQTVMGTALFYGWGVGLLGEWPNHRLLLAGLCIAAGQILFSRFWMGRFHYGPFEWLWRSLTYRRVMPFRRTAVPAV